jgi:transcriptional regulator with XRE-family HTH domain
MAPETPLARILRKGGKSQSWLAEEMRVHPGTISRWVTGKRPIPDYRLPALAKILGVSEDELRP